MIAHIIAFFISLIVATSGYDAPRGSHIDLCNGISVDNVDKVVYLYPYGYIAHFNFSDPATNVVIFDNCFDYSAVEISPDGFAHIDF